MQQHLRARSPSSLSVRSPWLQAYKVLLPEMMQPWQLTGLGCITSYSRKTSGLWPADRRWLVPQLGLPCMLQTQGWNRTYLTPPVKRVRTWLLRDLLFQLSGLQSEVIALGVLTLAILCLPRRQSNGSARPIIPQAASPRRLGPGPLL